MPKYVIERDLPGVGAKSIDELDEGARTSRDVLSTLSDRVQWRESYVTDDKIFCVYIADDEQAIREHGELSGFPVTNICRVAHEQDPTTAGA